MRSNYLLAGEELPMKIVQKLHKHCNNRLLCRKLNPPQAVEGTYVCVHCKKGTYKISAAEADLSAEWALFCRRQELDAYNQSLKEAHRLEMRRRRVALDVDAAARDAARQQQQQTARLLEDQAKREEERERRQEVLQRQRQESERIQQGIANQRREAERKHAAQQQRKRAEAESKRVLEMERLRVHHDHVIRLHEAEAAQERERQREAAPSRGSLERRKAQRRLPSPQSPPPGFEHQSVRVHNDPVSSSSSSRVYSRTTVAPFTVHRVSSKDAAAPLPGHLKRPVFRGPPLSRDPQAF
ncbi:hypothetical protein CYLTODRAFT_424859 [Cylindrobasidium torrendii FP15055 ss-10]|uniref:Uncharacterized protein n=1 Tax=Cylindrobasidium torrendii FP15055 ss-10 TaxID=1314674 RepID=A0A0D7B2Z2_9AGAR|nr:hypothetical protein CYLTODRAFT_424859 [Cylindrobasidium torrendii FP15055 ss-10]